MHHARWTGRRTLLLLGCMAWVLGVVASVQAAIRTPEPQFSEDGGSISWGPARAGVQFGLQLASPRKSYTFGDSVALMVKARNLGRRPVTLRTSEPFFREHAPEVKAADAWTISAQGVANYSGTVPRSVVTIPAGGMALVGRPVYGIRPRYPEDKSQLPALFAEAGAYQLHYNYYPERRVATASAFTVAPAGPGWETGAVRLVITGQGRDPAFRSFESAGVYVGEVPEEHAKDLMAIAAEEVRLIDAFNHNDVPGLTALLAEGAAFETADFSHVKPSKDGLTPGRNVTSTGPVAAAKFLSTVATLNRTKGFQRTRPMRLRMESCRETQGNLWIHIRQEVSGKLDAAATRDYARDLAQLARAFHQPLPKSGKHGNADPTNGHYTAVYSYRQTWAHTPTGWRIVAIDY